MTNGDNSKDNIWGRLKLLPEASTIIDIGIGDGGTPFLYSCFPQALYIFINPLSECKVPISKFLVNKQNVFFECAVGSFNGTVEINVANKVSRSSLLNRSQFPDNSFKTQETRRVPIKKLDDIVAANYLKYPLGVKIDTEGFELEVIKGGKNVLGLSSFVILEFHHELSNTPKFDYSLQDIINELNAVGLKAAFFLKDGKNIVFTSEIL
jgi:FkbM family methyltransferase